MEVIEGLLNGDTRSIARAISIVENRSPKKNKMVNTIYRETGKAKIFGVTGSPGSGKSTLVDKLIARFRNANETVAVIAIDPSSPYTGGAILGDRIRMQMHGSDEGVFIRSVASRGHLGGVSESTADIIKIFDSAGFDNIIVETIGVGQNEIEVVELADVVILVLVPQMGDEIQVLKAGVMEIGDIFVINKMDIDGAERVKAEVQYNLENKKDDLPHEVLLTSARSGDGLDELFDKMVEYYANIASSDELIRRRKRSIECELKNIIKERLLSIVEKRVLEKDKLHIWVEKLYRKELNIYELIDNNLEVYLKEQH